MVSEKDRPNWTIDENTQGLPDIAMKAYAGIGLELRTGHIGSI
jgi:hypothetical protein